MKKNFIIFNQLLILITILLMTGFSMNERKSDLFDDILKKTNSNPIECGIKAVFTTDEERENICNDILKRLEFYDGWNTIVLKNQQIYCVEFGRNNVKGYIEIIHYENHNVVNINIINKDDKDSLKELKNKLQQCLKDKKVKVDYSMYLKLKMQNNDVQSTNEQILKLLKTQGATNINTISINNGYSTTAYTKQYESIQSNGKVIDFNYAVCKYSSGSYIIIGTPEIIVTY